MYYFAEKCRTKQLGSLFHFREINKYVNSIYHCFDNVLLIEYHFFYQIDAPAETFTPRSSTSGQDLSLGNNKIDSDFVAVKRQVIPLVYFVLS